MSIDYLLVGVSLYHSLLGVRIIDVFVDVVVRKAYITAVLFPDMILDGLEVDEVVATASTQVGPGSSVNPDVSLYVSLDWKFFKAVGTLELVGMRLVSLDNMRSKLLFTNIITTVLAGYKLLSLRVF